MDFDDPVPTQMLALEEEKQQALQDCELCNQSGWVADGVMCVCLKGIMAKLRLLEANIPKNLSTKGFEDYRAKKSLAFRKAKEFAKNIQKAREKGIGLYIYGPPGSGKSLLAISILRHAAVELLLTGFYIKTSHWIRFLQDFERNPHGAEVVEWGTMETDILVLDDVDKYYKTKSGYVEAQIDRCVQKRVDDNRIMICTSEKPMEEVARKFGAHILSRMFEKMMPIQVPPNGDFRRDVLSKGLERELLG